MFVNRRGFAPSLKCVACAWEAGCPRCSARLVAHRVPPGLRLPPLRASRARSARVSAMRQRRSRCPAGHGTQRLERALAARFPDARIVRVDRDTTRRRGAFDDVRVARWRRTRSTSSSARRCSRRATTFRASRSSACSARTTRSTARDFRATERLAALLVQVAGRAGRAELPGEVIVQTDFPTHPLYAALSRPRLRQRSRASCWRSARVSGLPPFAHLALLTAEAHGREDVEAFLATAQRREAIAQRRRGPRRSKSSRRSPAPLARRAGLERAQMLLRSERARRAQAPAHGAARVAAKRPAAQGALGDRRRSAGPRVMRAGAIGVRSYNRHSGRARDGMNSANWSGARRAVQFARSRAIALTAATEARAARMTDLRGSLRTLLRRRRRRRGAPTCRCRRRRSSGRSRRRTATSRRTSRFSSRKRVKRNPRELAVSLSSTLLPQLQGVVEKIEIAGPGFLNLFLTHAARQARRARTSSRSATGSVAATRGAASASWSSSSRRIRPDRCTSVTAARRRSATRSRTCSSGRAPT